MVNDGQNLLSPVRRVLSLGRTEEKPRQEVALLRELGFDSLLMLPLEADGTAWGLVEVYDNRTDGFTPSHVADAQRFVVRAGAALSKLGGPAA